MSKTRAYILIALVAILSFSAGYSAPFVTATSIEHNIRYNCEQKVGDTGNAVGFLEVEYCIEDVLKMIQRPGKAER